MKSFFFVWLILQEKQFITKFSFYSHKYLSVNWRKLLVDLAFLFSLVLHHAAASGDRNLFVWFIIWPIFNTFRTYWMCYDAKYAE